MNCYMLLSMGIPSANSMHYGHLSLSLSVILQACLLTSGLGREEHMLPQNFIVNAMTYSMINIMIQNFLDLLCSHAYSNYT